MKSFQDRLRSDSRLLLRTMRNFEQICARHPAVLDDILALDAVAAESETYWCEWKNAVLDIGCDASDHARLATLIKRLVSSLARAGRAGERASDCLAALIRLVPSTTALLLASLDGSFPYWQSSHTAPQVVAYCVNVVALAEALPPIQDRVMELVVARAVQIDLALSADGGQLRRSSSDASLEAPWSSLPVTKEQSGTALATSTTESTRREAAIEQSELEAANQRQLQQTQDLSDKLDAILSILCFFMERTRTSDRNRFQQLAIALIRTFERNILPAFRPRFTQFLLFYAASCDQMVAERFLGFLVACLFARDAQLSHAGSHGSSGNRPSSPSIIGNSSSQVAILTTAAAFIGSFVARAKFLAPPLVRATLELLLDWTARKREALHVYNVPVDSRGRTSHAESSIFAAIVQAAILVLFALHDMQPLSPDDPLLSTLAVQLPAIFASPFAPLSHCSPGVVTSLATTLQSMDAETFAPVLATISTFPSVKNGPQSSLLKTATQHHSDDYYPFDPLVLPQTRKFISADAYREHVK